MERFGFEPNFKDILNKDWVPKFPDFRKIEIRDIALFQEYSSRFRPYSDFSFVSLYCWDIDSSTCISGLNNNLIIKMKHYTEDRKILIPFGSSMCEETVSELLTYTKKLELVPYEFINGLDIQNPNILIMEDPDNFDYIVSTDKVVRMEGGEYSKKRAKISKFKRENPDSEFRQVNISEFRTELVGLFDRWVVNHKSPDSHGNERQVLLKFLRSYEEFDVVCFCLFNGKELIGFNLLECINKIDTYGFLLKADIGVVGSTEYMIHETSRVLSESGYQTINIAQDLGIEAIRRFKEELRPVDILKKYTICMKE